MNLNLINEIHPDDLVEMNQDLDRFWAVTQFIPNPIPVLASKYHYTATHVLHVLISWVLSRQPRGQHAGSR